MRKYCKAYYLKDLQAFSGWLETQGDAELSEDAIVYLWDDFTVVKSPVVSHEGLILDTITPEWQNFCITTLHFQIPEDLQHAYGQSEKTFSENPEQPKTSA